MVCDYSKSVSVFTQHDVSQLKNEPSFRVVLLCIKHDFPS